MRVVKKHTLCIGVTQRCHEAAHRTIVLSISAPWQLQAGQRANVPLHHGLMALMFRACAQDKRAALMARLESDEATSILTGHCLARPSLDRRSSARSDQSLGAYSGGAYSGVYPLRSEHSLHAAFPGSPHAGSSSGHGTPRSPAAGSGGALFRPGQDPGRGRNDCLGTRRVLCV